MSEPEKEYPRTDDAFLPRAPYISACHRDEPSASPGEFQTTLSNIVRGTEETEDFNEAVPEIGEISVSGTW